jgi:hypothetical protein
MYSPHVWTQGWRYWLPDSISTHQNLSIPFRSVSSRRKSI